MARGFAVLDFETTGILPSKGHRVVEIGLVLLDENGDYESEWTTIVNPERDLGPTHVHGLRGADVIGAGTFADYAHNLVDRLSGRVLVAHNATFDIRFLNSELNRLGLESPLTSDDAVLDTLQLASSLLPGCPRSLEACCGAVGIENVDAHAALSDARATAQLFKVILDSCLSRQAIDDLLDRGSKLIWPHPSLGDAEPWVRGVDHDRVRSPIAASLSVTKPRIITHRENAFISLLEDVLADGLVTIEESQALLDCATELGLTKARLQELRHEFFVRLVAQVWQDQIVTADEEALLRSVGAWMSISTNEIDAAISGDRRRDESEVQIVGVGDTVVLTGDMGQPRSYYESILVARGYQVASSVSKKVKVVLVADVDSLSGKARRGRELGIPLVPIDEFLLSLA